MRVPSGEKTGAPGSTFVVASFVSAPGPVVTQISPSRANASFVPSGDHDGLPIAAFAQSFPATHRSRFCAPWCVRYAMSVECGRHEGAYDAESLIAALTETAVPSGSRLRSV